MKRVFDMTIAIIALVVFAPFLLLATIGIGLASPGPIFYRAKRVGRGGNTFEMLKFRSMHVSTGGSVITSANDPRIFPFGAFLRKTKIDELPQFLNVLKGDLSVVGPRPEDPKIVDAHYTDWMKETLDVLPGITSPGAIYYYGFGERLVDPEAPEQSYVERILPAKLAVDRAYIERANFWNDLVVVLHTGLAVLGVAVGSPIKPMARDLAEASRRVPTAFE